MTPAYRKYLASPEWAYRREEALLAAGYRCQVCNHDGDLHVHHRTYKHIGKEWPEDLTVLCRDCHALYHGIVRIRSETALGTHTMTAAEVATYRKKLEDEYAPMDREQLARVFTHFADVNDIAVPTDHVEALIEGAADWPAQVVRMAIKFMMVKWRGKQMPRLAHFAHTVSGSLSDYNEWIECYTALEAQQKFLEWEDGQRGKITRDYIILGDPPVAEPDQKEDEEVQHDEAAVPSRYVDHEPVPMRITEVISQISACVQEGAWGSLTIPRSVEWRYAYEEHPFCRLTWDDDGKVRVDIHDHHDRFNGPPYFAVLGFARSRGISIGSLDCP